MPITVRTDGILYNDGTLQVTAGGNFPKATTYQKGTVIPAPQVMPGAAPTGIDNAQVVTPYTIMTETGSFGPGVGQNWGNYTGSRAAGVRYTNTTRRGIAVTITCNKTGGWASASIYVNEVLANHQAGDLQGGFGGSNMHAFAIVPPGATYYAETTTGIAFWAELRGI